jgi:hypothetical protein
MMARGYGYADGASPEVDEARRPYLHRATLMLHAQSKNAMVREIIAAREDLPLGLMVTLAHDSSDDVRAAIAGNPSATPVILEHLAADRSTAVLIALIENPCLTSDLLEAMLFHKRPDVRRAAADRLDSRGLELVPDLEDSAVPELRDVAVGSGLVGADLAPRPLPALVAAGPPAVARPTRTAPVRGFRIPFN